jgi:3-oxoacyl-[acyl-carrier protein] reductase
MDLGLKNKTAIVFAASKGLGKAAALSLAKEGCNVAICSSNRNNIEKTAEEIRKQSDSEVFPAVVDLLQSSQIDEFLELVLEKWGKTDILVTNVGGPPVKSFEETTNEEWIKYFQIIVMSVITAIRKVLPGMQKQNWGRIINITSSAVKQPFPGLIYSNSLRSAVVGLTKTLSQEYGKYNIHFHNVAPGFFKTEGLERIVTKRVEEGETREEIYAAWEKVVPLNRIGKPEELAALIAFLASEQAGYMSGNTILADGGKFAGMY